MSNQTNFFYPPICKNVKINSFRIIDVKVRLFESASFSVLLYDTENNLCDSRHYEMPTCDYELWYNDDTYIIKWAKNKLQEESENNA
jgi:hypothetical protein